MSAMPTRVVQPIRKPANQLLLMQGYVFHAGEIT